LKRSNRLILLIGFFLAAIAFVGIVLLLGGGRSGGNGEGVLKSTVVVASADIPLGTTITDDLVQTQEVKETEKPVGSYTLESEVVGRTVTTQLTKGQLLDANAFATSTVNTDIARLLDPGRRAMSVQVDQVSGVGTLVKPGDRVDVVVGIAGADKFPVVSTDPQTDQIQVVPGINATSVKAIIQNLEVVGTLLPPPTDTGNTNNGETTDGAAPTLNGQTQIVILAVSAQEAEVLRFAQIDGTITLVLRSPDDKEAPSDATTGITLRQLVDSWAVIPPQIVETVVPGQKP
jgi:pilus assembly protein CpaB